MPWCEDCAKFWNPNSMPPDGACPKCGRLIADPPESQRAPWHFYLLVIGVVIYMGWRAVQGFQWLIGNGHTAIAAVIAVAVAVMGAWGAVWYLRRDKSRAGADADVSIDGE